MSGRSATTFAPQEIVSRAQMATFINNAQEFLASGLAFTTVEDYFVDDETSVHEDNINGIASVGIAQGIDATHYDPSGAVRRANMATFIVRYLAVLHSVGAIDPLPGPSEPPTPHLASVGERTAIITVDGLVGGATVKVYVGADGASFAASPLKTSSSVDADGTLAGFQVQVTGLTPATSYEYYVTQSSGGDESDPLYTTAQAETSLVTAAEAPPTVVSAAVNGGRPGSQLLLNFSEPVTPLTGAAAKVTVECKDALTGLLTTFSGAGTSVAQVDADTLNVGMNGTVPSGDTCKAGVGAGAVQDLDANPNAAQADIAVP